MDSSPEGMRAPYLSRSFQAPVKVYRLTDYFLFTSLERLPFPNEEFDYV